MRALLFSVVSAFLTVLISGTSVHALVAGGAAPTFTLNDLNGKTYDLSRMKGKQPIVLYFFDVDSRSCQEGLQGLSKLVERNKPDLKILAISGSPREKLVQFARNKKLPFPVLIDTNDVRVLYDARLILPVVCIIDKGLKVNDYLQGYGKATQDKLALLIGGETKTPLKSQLSPQSPQLPSDDSIKLTLATNKKVYTSGEAISLTAKTRQHAYLSIFHVASDGKVSLLLPNPEQPQVILEPADRFTFPPADVEIRAVINPGKKREKEQFIAVATDEQMNLEHELPANRVELMRLISKIPKSGSATAEYDIVAR